MTDTSKDFVQKLRETFRAEANEHLVAIVSAIVELEQSSAPSSSAVVERLLKTLHTLKGAARAVSHSEIETLCHALEGVFSALRTSNARLESAQFDLLHQAGRLARALIDDSSGRTRNQALALSARLNQLSAHLPEQMAEHAPPPALDAEPVETLPPEPEPAVAPAAPASGSDFVRIQGKSLDALRYQTEELLTVDLALQQHINDLLALAERMAEQQRKGTEVASRRARRRRTGGALPVTHAATDDASHENFERQCSRLAQALAHTRRQFAVTRARLMDAALETALVPLSSALEQLPGLIRNLARSRGKQAVLTMQGTDIQIDRRVLEVLRETLIHLVTNAVDHGIEPQRQRTANGKPPTGTICITAVQRGSSRIALAVSDDGQGIDVERVVAAATAGGGVKADEMAGADERTRLRLILQTGVSTAAQVTQVSGRGVGLAIVAEKVAAIGGDMEIDNVPGAGCTFTLLLPVRLSTLRGLIVRVADRAFVVPLGGLASVRSLRDGDIQTVENRETLVQDGRVIPVLRLRSVLGIDRVSSMENEKLALVVRPAVGTFALLVDEVLAEQEILPKSLGKQLRRVPYVSGVAQLGDGDLVPVLALDDIARLGLVPSDPARLPDASQAGRTSVKRILVAEDSITSRLLLKHILEGAGYQVETAVDGMDALSRLRLAEFDAVISDVEMPHLDGIGLAQRIRADARTQTLPVILVTSLHSAEDKERGLHAGADAYVVKGSFDQDNLLKTIRRLI